MDNGNSNKGGVICKDFMFKRCKFNEECKFLHDTTICFYHWKNGSCKYGEECNKSHDTVNVQYTQYIQKEKPKKNKDKYDKNKRNANKIHDNKIHDKKIHDNNTRNKKVKNTECFVPMTEPTDMRLIFEQNNTKCNKEMTSRDVLIASNIFSDQNQYEIYNKLLKEIDSLPQDNLLKMWHGNDKIEGTHLIANDRVFQKYIDRCPTFKFVIERLNVFFNMDIKATRFNWYKDADHWKPFHHDSAYVNPEKAKTQNFTVAASFGCTKDAAFQHAKTKTTLSIPQPDSTVYAFLNDTNAIWRHGILQDTTQTDKGRISIIAWGWIDNVKDI